MQQQSGKERTRAVMEEAEESEAPSALSLERPAKQGYLWKQSQWVKKWKKRWFVLWPNAPHRDKGRMLFYYLTPQDKRPRGVIALAPGSFTLMTSNGRSVKDRDFPLCLIIKLHGKRKHDSLELATDNETEVMAWAHAINSTTAIDDSMPNPGGADLIFSSTQLRDQLARDSDDDDDDLGGARVRAGAGAGAAHSGDDKMDLLIELDQVTSERDRLQKHHEVLQKALQLFLPSADLSSSGKLLEQAQHAASNRTEVSRLQQDLVQAQRRAADIERAREAEQARQRRDEQQLHDELQEIRAQNSTLRGDEQLSREEVEVLREEITRLRENSVGARVAPGAETASGTGEGGDEASGAEKGADSSESGSGATSVQQGPQQLVLEAELKQLRLDHKQACADAEQAMLEEQREHSIEKRRLEEMLTKTAKKNRELTARLESIDSSASSHGERMKELTAENRALMKEKNDSAVEAATTRKELERANAEIEQQDRQIQELEAEKGDTHDQLNLLTQQVAKLTQEKDSTTGELEAALENVGEVTTRHDEALAEIAQLKAQLKTQQDEAEAKRVQAESARTDFETKVRGALIKAKENQDRLEADNARLKAQLQQHGGTNA